MQCNRLQTNAPKSVGFMPVPVGQAGCSQSRVGRFDSFTRTAFGLCLEERSVKKGAAIVALDVPDFSMPKPEELDAALSKDANVIDLQAVALSKAVDKSKLN